MRPSSTAKTIPRTSTSAPKVFGHGGKPGMPTPDGCLAAHRGTSPSTRPKASFSTMTAGSSHSHRVGSRQGRRSMHERYDAIVIGTGQAGSPLAVRLANAGRKTAIIERKLIGGTCVNVGCIPTKTLIASARAAHVARRGADFGVTIDGKIGVDMARVKARKDAVVGQSNQGVAGWINRTANLTLIQGQVRFEGPHSLRVNGALLEAEQIFINVGGRATIPDMPGLAEVPYLTNTSMMEVDFIPEHLIVIGGSYIGLEFAQMYRRFGSRVTVLERGPRLLSRDDEDVAESIRSILENEGVAIRTCAAIDRLEQRDGGPVV